MSFRPGRDPTNDSLCKTSRLQQVLCISRYHVERAQPSREIPSADVGANPYNDVLLAQNRGLRPELSDIKDNESKRVDCIKEMLKGIQTECVIQVSKSTDPWFGLIPGEANDWTKAFFSRSVYPSTTMPHTPHAYVAEYTPLAYLKKPLNSGAWNEVYKIDINAVPMSSPILRDYAKVLQKSTMILRTSTLLADGDVSQKQSLRNVIMEFLIASYASRVGVGPELYFAWCTPKVVPVTYWHVEERAHHMVDQINTLSEEFDGDLAGVFLKDWFSECWNAVAVCIVNACKHGLFHGDLKLENLLIRRWKPDPSRSEYAYKVCYTDFDPRFVTLLDVNNPVTTETILCMAYLTMHMLLASAQCYIEDANTSSRLWNAAKHTRLAKDALYNAWLRLANETGDVEGAKAQWKGDRGNFCAWVPRGNHDNEVKQWLASHLRNWRGYLLGRPRCHIPSLHSRELVDFDVLANEIFELVSRPQ